MLRQIGNELREAREKRGISIADAQAETKIRSRYLEALEQGQFSVLPGGVYAKGFLKSYGDYLGLDGRDLVERFKTWQEQQEAQGQPAGLPAAPGAPVKAPPANQAAAPAKKVTASVGVMTQAKGTQPKAQPAARKSPAAGAGGFGLTRPVWAALGALLVVGIAVGGWLAWRGSGPAQGSPSPGPGVEQPKGPGPSTPGQQPSTGGQGTPAGSGAITVKPETPPDAYTIPFSIAGAAGKSLKLTIVARDSCWVRLERAGGDAVEETLTAGVSRVYEFTGEARLKLGNPPGVSVKVEETALPDPTYAYPVTYVFTRQ